MQEWRLIELLEVSKEGVIKRKRKRKRSSQPVETRSVCPSLDQIAFMSTSYPHISLPYNSIFQTSSLLHGSQAIPLTTYPWMSAAKSRTPVCAGVTAVSTTVTPTCTQSSISGTWLGPMLPSISIGPSPQVTSCSSGQIVVGSVVLNSSVTSPVPHQSNGGSAKQPFTLKLRTNLIRIWQSCRKGFEETNDTMGLVVAWPERRLASNMATGVTFLGKKSNSYYHLHMACIVKADSSFNATTDLIIPSTLELNVYQKLYLTSCFNLCVWQTVYSATMNNCYQELHCIHQLLL